MTETEATYDTQPAEVPRQPLAHARIDDVERRLSDLERLDRDNAAYLTAIGQRVRELEQRVAVMAELIGPAAAEACPGDCAELWRLARMHVSTWEGVGGGAKPYRAHNQFRAYVREHS